MKCVFSIAGIDRSNQCRSLCTLFYGRNPCHVHHAAQYHHHHLSICLANDIPINSTWLAECLVPGTSNFLGLPLVLLESWSDETYKRTHHQNFCFFDLQGYFIASSREITRLDSITKAPVIHHFSESISGVTTIRCFRKQIGFTQENVHRVDENLRMDFHNNGSNEWLGFRLELIGSFIMCLSTMFMILLPSSIIKPGIRLCYHYGNDIILIS